MMKALGKQADPYKRSMYCTSGNMKAVEGGDDAATIIDRNAAGGVLHFKYHDQVSEKIHSVLTNKKAKSVFAEAHATAVLDAIDSTDALATILEDVTLTENFPDSQIGRQMKQVAKLVKSRSDLDAERDFFMLEDTGYDTHFNIKSSLITKFADMNAALDKLVKELKAEGVWDDVVCD